jgi:hypothetical protein
LFTHFENEGFEPIDHPTTRRATYHTLVEHVYEKIPIRDFPDETPPTNVVGSFAEHTEAWSVEQRFSWFPGVSIMEIWNAIFTILTLLTHTRRHTNRPAPSPWPFRGRVTSTVSTIIPICCCHCKRSNEKRWMSPFLTVSWPTVSWRKTRCS